MRIGYPCINRSIGCSANTTFRLANYSEERLVETVANNLACLEKILHFNREHGLLFFRLSSAIVPFASHPVCRFDWVSHFATDLRRIGQHIRTNGMRVSMHPDQFVLINAIKPDIIDRSIKELQWHCTFLDAMSLPRWAKVQIHIGGLYGDRDAAIARFIDTYRQLPQCIRKRLVIENDDRLFAIDDCMRVHQSIGIPVVFDNLHQACLGGKLSFADALRQAASTWLTRDGALMVDYSSQAPGQRNGRHAEHIDRNDFTSFLKSLNGLECDIMLEIKDKESSALEAVAAAKNS